MDKNLDLIYKITIFAANYINTHVILHMIMKKKSSPFQLVVLVAAMMCALGARAQEAYACYTSDNTTLSFYYDDDRNIRTGTTYFLNTDNNDAGWDTDGTKANVTRVVFDPSFADARPTTTYGWFYGMTNLQSVEGLEHLNTSKVTRMDYMFYDCYRLTNLDLSHFNTANVTRMSAMFSRCSGLTTLDLRHFNTATVDNMEYMFNACTSLRTIYVSIGWSTAAVTGSINMFYNCTSLVGGQGTTWNSSNPTDKAYAHFDGGTSNPGYFTELKEAYACYTPENTTLTFYYDGLRIGRPGRTYDMNQGEFDTGWDIDNTNHEVTKVVFDPSFAGARPTTTWGWFYRMWNLESIQGLTYLNTSEVEVMAFMFDSCYKLTTLDLSSFNTAQVYEIRHMFIDCNNLRTIYVGDGWTTASMSYTWDMFKGCTSLVGGQGTTYDANHVDKDYAHIDGGTSNPGYFTAKSAAQRGDINGDGLVNVADVTALIQIILNSTPVNQSITDLNNDNNVNVADVTALIQIILNQ